MSRSFRPPSSPAEPAPDPFDIRGDPRIGTELGAQLFSTDFAGGLPARTRDVSVGGACLATASPFAWKGVQRVVLGLADGDLQLEAQGRWQEAMAGDDVVMTGVEFVSPGDAAVDRLWDLVLDGAKELARYLYTGSDLRPLGVDGAVALSQITRSREVRAGQSLYRQGADEPAQASIFLVREGAVVLQVRVRDAFETPIDRVEPGGVFGGLAMLAGVPATESAIAECDTRLLEFDARGFRYLTRTKPWLAQQLSQIVTCAYVRRLHQVLGRVQDQLPIRG